jgi:hypothetical protein
LRSTDVEGSLQHVFAVFSTPSNSRTESHAAALLTQRGRSQYLDFVCFFLPLLAQATIYAGLEFPDLRVAKGGCGSLLIQSLCRRPRACRILAALLAYDCLLQGSFILTARNNLLGFGFFNATSS